MNLRAFLDANVVFTAAYNPQGLARLLFELKQQKVLELLSCEPALEEARINLKLKKPAALDDLGVMSPLLEIVPAPARHAVGLDLPEDDLLIFASALAGRATHFITGDKKDFGPLFNKPSKTSGVRIQTVRQFFEDRFLT